MAKRVWGYNWVLNIIQVAPKSVPDLEKLLMNEDEKLNNTAKRNDQIIKYNQPIQTYCDLPRVDCIQHQ